MGHGEITVGITAAIASIGDALSAITVSDVAIGAGVGALGGGALAGVEGKPILPGAGLGAVAGGITGGAIDFGGALGGAAGIGATAGDVLGGAAGGALGAGVTGGNPLIGAAGGALSGGIAGVGNAGSTPEPGAAGTGGGGAAVGSPGVGAGGIAAPASVAADTAGADGLSIISPGAAGNTGTVGQALAATDPAAAAVPGPPTASGLPGVVGTAPPSGSELAPVDAAALQGQVGASLAGSNNAGLSLFGQQIPGTNATGAGLSANAAGNPELNTSGAATEAAGPAGPSTTQVSPNVSETTGLGDGAGAVGAAAGKTTNWGNFGSDPFGTVGQALTNNGGWLAPAAGLGLAAIRSETSGLPSSSGTAQALQGQANTLNANSATLESYLQTGTLPTGVQNSIHSATQSAKAAVRSQYASRGMSGSSAEAQDLAAIDTNASSQGANIAMQLLQTGVTEAGLANQIYGQLLQATTAQDQQLSSAIGNFASSMVPRTPTFTINQSSG